MKNPNTFLLILLGFLLVGVPAIGQTKYDKSMEKSETLYDKGKYKKALKKTRKMGKKAAKKYGANNQFTSLALLKEAKYKEARGFYGEFDSLIVRGVRMSATANGTDNINHALALLDAADILINYGNFNLAGQYARDAKKILESSGQTDETYTAKLDIILAKTLTGQGFYNESLTLINDNMDLFSGRATKKVTYVDEKSGKIKTKRLPEEEVKDRFNDFATIITLKADTYRRQGSFVSADSAFRYADVWIGKNLAKNDIRNINNTYEWAKLLEENGLKGTPTSMYKSSLKIIKRSYAPTHVLYIDIYESLMKSYLINDEKRTFRKERKDFEKYLKKRFAKKSFHREKETLLSLDRSFASDKVGRIEGKAQSYLVNNQLLPKNHPRREQLLNFLYNVAIADKKYPNAEMYLNEILVVRNINMGDDSPEFHLTKTKLANHYVGYTNKIKEAGEIYQTSFQNIVNKQIRFAHVDYVEILNTLAEYYEISDNYKMASATLDLALDATRRKYDDSDMAYAAELTKIADLQIKIGEYTKATTNLELAKGILKKVKHSDVDFYRGVTLETEAKLLAVKGLLDEAEDNLNAASKLIRKSSSAIAYNEQAAAEELAELNIVLGKYSKSASVIDNTIKEYTRLYGGESRNLLRPVANAAKIKLIYGDYTEAEKLIRRNYNNAVSIYGANSSKVAPSLIVLSDLYSTIGDYEKAEDNIKKALELQRKQFGQNHIDVATSISKLALIRFYQDAPVAEVEKLMLQSKEIISAQLGAQTPKYADIITDLAKVYIQAGRFDEAFDRLNEAQRIWEKKAGKRNNIKSATIFILMGDIHYIQRRYKRAEEQYVKAKSLYERNFSKQHPEYVKVVSKLSKVYYMDGDTRKSAIYLDEAIANYDKFIREYFPALSEREKAKFWNTIRSDYEFYNTVAVKLQKERPEMVGNMYNNALNTKALLLSSSIKMRERILSSTDENLKAKYADWVGKKELLTNVLSMSPTQLAENGINQHVLEMEVEQLEKYLSEKSELFAQGFEDKAMSWNTVKKILKPNEAALEMIRYRHFDHILSDSIVYAILYVKNDAKTQPDLILLNNGKDLEGRYLKSYRNSIRFRIEDKLSYDQYWAPIKNRVGEFTTLYISPDGVYNQINLEAIPTKDGKYVIDNSNIVLVSNTKDIYFRRVKTQLTQEAKEAVIFGNPIFYASNSGSGKINQLPGTQREIIELKKLFSQNGWMADDFMEGNATEESLKQMVNPKIFHIATHGFFTSEDEVNAASVNSIELNESASAANPLLRTGLLLSGAGDLLDKTSFNYNMEDGILTAYEAMNLNLDLTDLVVLSACETGLGDVTAGEGVYGLQRAFMVAGAKSLVMSLFKVSDEATQKLMVTFYKKWLETGNKRESFVEAKKELRNEYKDPIYWGAFVMLGMD